MVNPLMVLSVGEPSMLIVFDAVSTVAVPVLPSCSTSREMPSPMNVLPENARFPPALPLSVPGKKPAGPVVATRRLSSNRSLAPVSVSPGMPEPTVTTLLVKVIDPAPSTPATPACPSDDPALPPKPPAAPRPPLAARVNCTLGAVSVSPETVADAPPPCPPSAPLPFDPNPVGGDPTGPTLPPLPPTPPDPPSPPVTFSVTKIAESLKAVAPENVASAGAPEPPAAAVPAIARREAAVPAGTSEAALTALAACRDELDREIGCGVADHLGHIGVRNLANAAGSAARAVGPYAVIRAVRAGSR